MTPTMFEVRLSFLLLGLISLGNLAEAAIDGAPWWKVTLAVFTFALWMSLLFGSLKCVIRPK